MVVVLRDNNIQRKASPSQLLSPDSLAVVAASSVNKRISGLILRGDRKKESVVRHAVTYTQQQHARRQTVSASAPCTPSNAIPGGSTKLYGFDKNA